MREVFAWSCEIEADGVEIAETIANDNWINGEYSDCDSNSGVGSFEITNIRMLEE